MAVVDSVIGLLYLPDLVIHRILEFLPTKDAVRMSVLSKEWDGIWCSAPNLDFDEGDKPGKYDNDHIDLSKIHDHRNFINIVGKWMNYREKDQFLLDKFRLHMKRYVPGDYDMIDECLISVFERGGAKELNLSLKLSRLFCGFSSKRRLDFYYCITRRNLVNAETLTCLKLEYVRITDLHSSKPLDSTLILPNVKTMYLKNVHFDNHGLFFLIWECPSIEDLSLTKCSFESSEIHVLSSSLRSLQVDHCKANIVTIDEARNLESFTFSSNSPHLRTITLIDCIKLKYIYLYAEHLKVLNINGSHDGLKAILNTPNLVTLIVRGFLKAEVCVKSPHLKLAGILLEDLMDGDLLNFNGPWKHFLELRDFLDKISYPEEIIIFLTNFKDIIFPEDFRRKFTSPARGVSRLKLNMATTPTRAKDISDFNDSLKWLVPFADTILVTTYVYRGYMNSTYMYNGFNNLIFTGQRIYSC